MSYAPGAYVPPPPPDAGRRRGMSPWAYLGIGCLAVFLLTIAALGFGVYKFTSTFNAPIDKTEVLAALGPVPVYPKAQFDVMTTKIARATGGTMKMALGGKDFAGAAFHTAAAPKDVIGWYDVQLSVLGYKVIRTRTNTFNEQEGQTQHQYFKKGEMVIVQAQPMTRAARDNTPDTPDTLLMLMRIQGVTKQLPTTTKSNAGN